MRLPEARVRVPVLPRPARVAGAVAVALVILYFSVIKPPSDGVPVAVLGIAVDKWLHVASYAAFAGALGYARLAPGDRLDRRGLALVLLVAAGYGVGIELVQAQLPQRAFSLADVVANGIGAALGTVPWRLFRGA